MKFKRVFALIIFACIGLGVFGQDPTVTGVTSSTTNGTYKLSDGIDVTVNFSEAVDVDVTSGTIEITLETGATDRTLTYTGGTVTNVSSISFSYTVQSGDESADLDYKNTTSLVASGGATILANDNSNAAVLTLATPGAAGSLRANKDLVVDGIVPTVSSVTSSTTNGTYKLGDVIDV
ncbi:MAG: hypothetical protein K9G38_07810, partial [Bacteroidales bacterium]|nr:hypothetical protein [Bacteroidales bacterium]